MSLNLHEDRYLGVPATPPPPQKKRKKMKRPKGYHSKENEQKRKLDLLRKQSRKDDSD